MQASQNILPEFLNLDGAYESLLPNEAPFIKDLGNELNANPDSGIGANNPANEGQNAVVLTPTRANVIIPDVELPAGYNKTVFSFESKTTQEYYFGNYNSEGNHGIYVYSGNTGICQRVIIDPELLFTDDPAAYMAEHRATLRTRTNGQNEIIEKAAAEAKQITDEKIQQIKDKIKSIVADSSNPRMIFDLGKRFNIRPVVKPGVIESIRMVQEYEIIISETSYNLQKESQNYIWSDK